MIARPRAVVALTALALVAGCARGGTGPGMTAGPAAASVAAAGAAAPGTPPRRDAVPTDVGSTATQGVGLPTATVSGSDVVLRNSRVRREWSLLAGGRGIVDTALVDIATGTNWVSPGSSDFSLTIDEVPFTSRSFAVLGVSAQAAAPNPARPRDQHGAQVVFRLGLPAAGLPVGIEVDRVFTLFPGSATIEVGSVLVNHTPAPLRVGRYSLDEVTTAAAGTIEVQAYNGGSDWRDDYRHVVFRAAAPSDDEGEVLRFDGGRQEGFFLVSQRRGGAMSRAGRDAGGRTWIGVDNARDLLDGGPLLSSPPDYNRVTNPAYPAPVRERTVLPLGTLQLGAAYTGVYHGGAQEAARAFASDFDAHAMPSYFHSVGLNTFHPWSHSGLLASNLVPQVTAGKALGLEAFMLDDQWQGQSSGDWHFDLSRFPDTTGAKAPDGEPIPDFVTLLHQQGIAFGLWMSLLEFNGGSQTYKQHPDWVCTPTGDATAQIQNDAGLGVWDVSNPGFRAYIAGVVDRLVNDYGVAEFKFDFLTWVDCAPHDYLDYEDAFVSLVDQLEAKHPNVTFEIDETNDQRAWAFESAQLGPSWFDNSHTHGSTEAAKQLHDLWTAAPWLPPSSLGFGVYDGTLAPPYTAGFLMPAAILGHFTFWTDLTQLAQADAAETAWWIAWYKQHRDALGGFVYEDTQADPIDGQSTLALQPWDGSAGYLFVFSQAAGTRSVALQGLDPGRSYQLTNVRTGQTVGVFPGATLASGLGLALQPYSALVLSVNPAN